MRYLRVIEQRLRPVGLRAIEKRLRPGGLRAITLLVALGALSPIHGAVAGPAPSPAPAPAPAPAKDIKAQAAALYKEGVGLFREKKYREASDRFQAAYNLDPSPILLYNLARAAEELGDAATAVNHYRAYLARNPQAEDKADVERRIRVLDAVSKQIPPGQLRLQGVSADAAITLNGQPPPAPGPDGRYALPPGKYIVQVRPVGGLPREQTLELASGAQASLNFGAPGVEDTSQAESPGRPLRLAGYITLGAGVVTVGVGGFFHYQSFGAADDYAAYGDKIQAAVAARQDTTRLARQKKAAEDDVNSNLTVARVLYGIGGAAVAAGVTLVVVDALGAGSAEPATGTAVVPYPGGLGFVTAF